MKKKLLIALLAVSCIAALAVTGCSGSSSSASKSSSSSSSASTATASGKLTFGSSFDFDDLTITIGDAYEVTTIDNQFSDWSGKDILALPITIKNNKDESHGLNMFYVTSYGSAGTKLDTVYTYFDDGMSTFNDMRSGATVEGHLYLPYDGDGDYVIEFAMLTGKKTEVEIPVAL